MNNNMDEQSTVSLIKLLNNIHSERMPPVVDWQTTIIYIRTSIALQYDSELYVYNIS